MKRLRWRKHWASDAEMPQNVARVGALAMIVSREEGRGWRFDLEIESLHESTAEHPREADARRAAHEGALAWARGLVRELEATAPRARKARPAGVTTVPNGEYRLMTDHEIVERVAMVGPPGPSLADLEKLCGDFVRANPDKFSKTRKAKR